MADEKLNTGPAENTSPEAAGPITTPEQAAASEPRQEQTGPTIPEPGDVVVSFDKINELMAEKRQNARAEVEKAEPPETPEAAVPGETPQPANTEEPKKPRRGRPPKAEKAATENQKAEKSAGARKGRPPKADKAAPDKPKPSKRDKVSRSDGKAPDAKEPIKPAQDTAPKETAAAEPTAPEPTTPPRPVEEGKLVYLKLSEVHPFHTFRPHPFKVRDDAKMQEIVASIRVNGVMVPGLARPEKDGNGYEIVAGHRRTHGSELAGLEEMPFIVREMTDHEAVQAMKDSNKQRDGMLPSELAALLELEVEDIKHQGGRLKGVAEGDVGKRSVEIVGEAHEMNYKKVKRDIFQSFRRHFRQTDTVLIQLGVRLALQSAFYVPRGFAVAYDIKFHKNQPLSSMLNSFCSFLQIFSTNFCTFSKSNASSFGAKVTVNAMLFLPSGIWPPS